LVAKGPKQRKTKENEKERNVMIFINSIRKLKLEYSGVQLVEQKGLF